MSIQHVCPLPMSDPACVQLQVLIRVYLSSSGVGRKSLEALKSTDDTWELGLKNECKDHADHCTASNPLERQEKQCQGRAERWEGSCGGWLPSPLHHLVHSSSSILSLSCLTFSSKRLACPCQLFSPQPCLVPVTGQPQISCTAGCWAREWPQWAGWQQAVG